jgi:hypothetical protein
VPVLARRYEVYLPVEYNDLIPIEDEAYDQIEQDLLQRFGGVTQIRRANLLKGVWQQAEDVYHDNIVMFTVLDFSETLENNQQFMTEYKEFLKQKLQQKEIVITFHELYVL